jgi:hypothetical protein
MSIDPHDAVKVKRISEAELLSLINNERRPVPTWAWAAALIIAALVAAFMR